MRVVGGKYKGRRFSPPRNFPSRPTTDFAKESLFNILDHEFDWEGLEILDLFSGTGNISLEFLSRGVNSVLSVDNHPVSLRFLSSLKSDLNDSKWSIQRSDAFTFLEQCSLQFSIIFCDPPFDLPNQQKLVDLVFERNLLLPQGILIIEHGRENDFHNKTQFREIRNYGGVCFSFFED